MIDTKNHDSSELGDVVVQPAEPALPSEHAKRAALIVCAVLMAVGPAALALWLGVRMVETGRVLLLTVAALAAACLLLRPR
ncbi:hypothetical protein [Rhodococcus sp. ACT016]|uniref:hypothetical protein n=1 Tax=Rhodococcus sp. ACT016 TaxID=3134808 RepID=UPI003D2DBF69